MAQPTTHLGTKELHKRHSVMIEGGKIPRAKVMDQHIVDRYLINGDITLAQHRAAEYLLNQAATAGFWATGVDLSRTQVQTGRPNNVPFRIFPFGRTITAVRRRYGDFHAYLVQEVVCHDWDIRNKEGLMDCLKESLDWIAERRMAYVPIQRLQKVMKKRAPQVPATG